MKGHLGIIYKRFCPADFTAVNTKHCLQFMYQSYALKLATEQRQQPSAITELKGYYRDHAREVSHVSYTHINTYYSLFRPASFSTATATTNSARRRAKEKLHSQMWNKAAANNALTEGLNLWLTAGPFATGNQDETTAWKRFSCYQVLWCVIQTGAILDHIKGTPKKPPVSPDMLPLVRPRRISSQLSTAQPRDEGGSVQLLARTPYFFFSLFKFSEKLDL